MIILVAGLCFFFALCIGVGVYLGYNKPRWRVVYRCAADACSARLTWDEVAYSRGVCPHCGYTSEGTVLAARKTSEWR